VMKVDPSAPTGLTVEETATASQPAEEYEFAQPGD
jgi:hypothetical protein